MSVIAALAATGRVAGAVRGAMTGRHSSYPWRSVPMIAFSWLDQNAPMPRFGILKHERLPDIWKVMRTGSPRLLTAMMVNGSPRPRWRRRRSTCGTPRRGNWVRTLRNGDRGAYNAGEVFDLFFSRDSRRLYVGTRTPQRAYRNTFNDRLRVWEVETNTLVNEFRAEPTSLKARLGISRRKPRDFSVLRSGCRSLGPETEPASSGYGQITGVLLWDGLSPERKIARAGPTTR